MRFMDRIEQEFGEPFDDVLQGFADMGYGCDTTARMLDYDIANFRRLLKRHGIKIEWPRTGERVDAYERNPWPGCERMIATRRAKCRQYTHPETGEAMIASAWARRLGISTTQFQRRVQKYGNQKRVYLPNLRRAA